MRSYVKKFPGLNVNMSCSVSSPRNSVAASKPRPMAKPSPQAVMPSPTKESLQLAVCPAYLYELILAFKCSMNT